MLLTNTAARSGAPRKRSTVVTAVTPPAVAPPNM